MLPHTLHGIGGGGRVDLRQRLADQLRTAIPQRLAAGIVDINDRVMGIHPIGAIIVQINGMLQQLKLFFLVPVGGDVAAHDLDGRRPGIDDRRGTRFDENRRAVQPQHAHFSLWIWQALFPNLPQTLANHG